MTFSDWVQTDAEKLVRIDLTAHDGSSQVNKYIASRYYYDDVNDIEYLDRLIDPLIIRRSMNWQGGAAEASVGAISIDNSDREFDDWIDWAWGGWSVEVLLGDPSWAADDSRWSTRFKGLADKMEAEDYILTLFTRDKSEKLNRPIVQRPLIPHESAFLEPFPVTFGNPKNVSPPIRGELTGVASGNPIYVLAPWGNSQDAYSAVYENGKETTKSLTYSVGGSFEGRNGFAFDGSAPQGAVTADAVGVPDESNGGTRITEPADIIVRALSWDAGVEFGICVADGSTTEVKCDENASTVDDQYVGGSQSVTVRKRGANSSASAEISDYDGGTRTITTVSSLGFSSETGDLYQINVTTPFRYGPLETSDVSVSADLPTYDVGIWDRGGEMTLIDLLNTIFPAGFYYYWGRESVLTCGPLEDPSKDSSVFTIDQYESRGKIRIVQEDTPIYRARVGYDRNWTVMNSPDDTVSVDRAAFLAREYLWELDEDLSVMDQYPESTSQDFPSYILGRADAQAEAKRLMDLYGVARKRIMVEGLSGLLGVDLNDVVTLKDDTYDLQDGKDYRVVMMEERPIEGTVDVELWG